MDNCVLSNVPEIVPISELAESLAFVGALIVHEGKSFVSVFRICFFARTGSSILCNKNRAMSIPNTQKAVVFSFCFVIVLVFEGL